MILYAATTGYVGATERHVVGKLVMTAEVLQQIAALLFANEPDKTLDELNRAAAH